MTTTLSFNNGLPGFDWQDLLQQVLQSGTYDEADATGYGQVTLHFGDMRLFITSATNDLDLSGGALVAGTVTSVSLQDDADQIFTSSFDHNVTYQAVQDLVGTVPDQQTMLAGLLTWFGGQPVNATGSNDGDVIYGGTAADNIDAGDGRDTLVGGAGNDTLTGGNGGDNWDDLRYDRETGTGGVVVNLSGDDQGGVLAGTATDTFGDTDTLDGIEFVGGSAQADIFYGKTGDENSVNFFMGGDGADTFVGGDGFDGVAYDLAEIESGGSGVIVNLSNDAFDAGGETIAAGTARDTFGNIDELQGPIEGVGGSQMDDVILLGDDDKFNRSEGYAGNDYIVGNAGDDLIFGGDGADDMRGDREDGSGHDRDNDDDGQNPYFDMLSYEFETGTANGPGVGITLNVGMGRATDTYGNTDYFSGFEGFRGSQYADHFIGAVWDNSFEGMAGDDTIDGGGGRDHVDYGAESGMNGGVVVDLQTSVDLEGQFVGTATDTYGDTDTLIAISNLSGTDDAGGDTLTGHNGRNYIEGRGGNDIINGEGGEDDLHGDDGNDTINGGSGRDQLQGGDGNDSLVGGSGDDNLRGDRGNDVVDGGSGQDWIEGGSGTDIVDGGSASDTLTFDGYDPADINDAAEHDSDGVVVTLNEGGGSDLGAGSITGLYGEDDSDVNLAVATTFKNIERIRGTHNADSFIATDSGFEATDESDDTFGDNSQRDIRSIALVGGKGADTFNITQKAIVDYDEEKWTHRDFNGDNDNRWGDDGQYGVAINVSSSAHNGLNQKAGSDQSGANHVVNLAANTGRDTYDNVDVLTAALAFRLTDANDIIYASDTGTWVDARRGDDTFVGGTGNDQFNGEEGNDSAIGGNGADSLNGSQGNDYLDGGDGDDNINGDDDNDTLIGGNGDDDLNGSQGNDSIDGGADNDHLNGDDGNDTLIGGTGHDQLNAGQGNDNLNGGDGNDNLNADDGNDTLVGGNGLDELGGGQGQDSLDGGAGNDRLNGEDGNDTAWGGLGNDRVNGQQGNDVLHGDDAGHSALDGDDEMNGDDGNDTVFGGYGDDRINGQQDNDQLFGDQGDDELSGNDGNDTVVGGLGDDDANGQEQNDVVSGDDAIAGRTASELENGFDVNGGNDRVFGEGGNDTLYGGYGDDEINAGDGSDKAYGGAGNDQMNAGDDNSADTLVGGLGNDQLNGGSGNDSLDGGGGNDDIYGGNGNFADVLVGGSGNDNLGGGDGNDDLDGGTGNDDVHGDEGNDVVTGGSGIDQISGGDGNDTLNGDGNDRFYGDNGNDTYNFGNRTSIVDMWENSGGGSGTDTVVTSITRNLNVNGSGFNFSNIENATLTGSADADLTGNGLKNVLTGNSGDNSLSGGNANDTLDGGSGKDALVGGNNNDSLIGGAGRDTLTGGANNDRFVFKAVADSGTTATTRDLITDFVHSTDDIDLSAIDADTTKSGNQAFVLDAKGSSGTAVAKGHIGWYQENPSGGANDKTIIKMNIDGDATVEMTIELKGLVNLTSGDFIL